MGLIIDNKSFAFNSNTLLFNNNELVFAEYVPDPTPVVTTGRTSLTYTATADFPTQYMKTAWMTDPIPSGETYVTAQGLLARMDPSELCWADQNGKLHSATFIEVSNFSGIHSAYTTGNNVRLACTSFSQNAFSAMKYSVTSYT